MMQHSLAISATIPELAAVGLRLTVLAGAFAAVLAIVVLALSRMLKRWLTPVQKCLLWGIVLLRLLILWAPASSWSLQTFFLPVSKPAIASPDMLADWQHLPAIDAREIVSATPISRKPSPAEEVFDWLGAVVPLAWIAGGLMVVARTVVLQWLFSRRVRRAPECQDARLSTLWTTCRAEVGLRRAVPLIVCDAVRQPGVMGLLRPRVLLPSDIVGLDDDQLRMIMLHELAHIKRFDIATNWLLVCVQAIHWWNPIYWFVANRFCAYREQACDAFVLGEMQGLSHRTYRELILELAGRQTVDGWRVSLPVSLLGFLPVYFRKRALRERLHSLQFTRAKPRSVRTLAALTIFLVMAACGLTSATPPREAAPQAPAIVIEGIMAPVAHEIEPGPPETKVYNLARLLARLRADDPNETRHRAMIKGFVANLVQPSSYRPQISTAVPSPTELTAASPERTSSYQIVGDRLTMHAPADVQAQLAALLATWEASGMAQISVECRFITADEDIAASVGLVWRYQGANSSHPDVDPPAFASTRAPLLRAQTTIQELVPVGIVELTAEQVRKFIQQAQSDRRVNVLQAPKLTLFNGQSAFVLDITQRGFAVGAKADPQGTQQLNPCVLEQGIKVAFRPVHSADQSKVQLNGRVELHAIDDAHESQVMLHGKPTAVTIPSAKQHRIDVACDLADGGSALIGCICNHLEKRILYTLLTVRILENPGSKAAGD